MIPNTTFLKTAAFIETQHPFVEVSYLKWKILNYPILEEDGLTNLSLDIASNTLYLTKKTATASNTKIDFERLSKIGIDVNSAIESTLYNDYSTCVEGRLYDLYQSLGEENYPTLYRDNSWQRLIRSIFKYKRTHYIKDHNDLVYTILHGSNSIQVSSRMGYADFVILSPVWSSIIMESATFVPSQNRDNNEWNVVQIGTLHNIKIFTKTTAKDDVIIFGRDSKMEHASIGVVFAKMPSEVKRIEDAVTHSFYTTHKTYDVIDKVDAEQSYRSYLTMPVTQGKTPRWQKLFKL